jgi:AraC-like DNA-binding protein
MNAKSNSSHDWLAIAKKANWSVVKFAKECNVSVRTLERNFLKNLGETPKAWLAKLRHSQAVILLQEGGTIKEVADILNYKNPHHFSREFKKQNGCPPSKVAASSRGCQKFFVLND